MERKGDQVVKDTLVPIKTRYLVIDNGGKSSYYTFTSFILTRTIYSQYVFSPVVLFICGHVCVAGGEGATRRGP